MLTDREDAIRPWCAMAQFPGKKPFIGGTVIIHASANSSEIIDALRAHFLTFLPEGFEIVKPIAGAIFFNGDAE